MAKSLIRIMLSSRCLDPFPAGSGTTLTDLRKELKAEIESVQILGRKPFEVWINEDAPPAEGTQDSWDACLQAVRDCDVLMGIVALLVSLAGFADRAGELRGRRRGQLLQLLCYAEAVGCDFILGLMPAASICCDDTELDADPEPPVADAARLAAGLRVLALVLYTIVLRCAARSRAVVRLDAGRQPNVPSACSAAISSPDTS